MALKQRQFFWGVRFFAGIVYLYNRIHTNIIKHIDIYIMYYCYYHYHDHYSYYYHVYIHTITHWYWKIWRWWEIMHSLHKDKPFHPFHTQWTCQSQDSRLKVSPLAVSGRTFWVCGWITSMPLSFLDSAWYHQMHMKMSLGAISPLSNWPSFNTTKHSPHFTTYHPPIHPFIPSTSSFHPPILICVINHHQPTSYPHPSHLNPYPSQNILFLLA